MNKLLFQLLLLALALYLTVIVSAYLCRQELDPDNYLSVITDKHQLLENTSSSRVIFIGDSSLAFGLDGERIKQEIKRPVVNMGLHAAFGLPFVFSEIAPDLKEGDTVIAIFHYYPNINDVNEGVICHALDFYPTMYDRLDLNIFSKTTLQFTCKVKKIRRYLLNKTLRKSIANLPVNDRLEFDYKRWAFKLYGDIRDELHTTSTINFSNDRPTEFYINQKETLATLNNYNGLFKTKGVRLILAYPPYPLALYSGNRETLEAYDLFLRSNTQILILNKPEDTVLPEKYFFNSPYHLTSLGKSIYTELIIKLIKKELNP
jgi:hypothetical protein